MKQFAFSKPVLLCSLILVLIISVGCPLQQLPPDALAMLSISPTALDFGAVNEEKTFGIRNSGSGTLTWSLTEVMWNSQISEWQSHDISWLSVEGAITRGSTTTETDVISLVVNREGVDRGTYSGVGVYVASDGGDATISVSMEVPADVQALSVQPSFLDFGTQLFRVPFTLNNLDSEPIDWSISLGSLPVWATLVAEQASGTLGVGQQLTMEIAIDRTGLCSGLFEGSFTIYSSSGNVVVSLRGGGGGITAEFVTLPSSGTTPLEVEFLYHEPVKMNLITSWAWDFDNNGTVDSTEPNPVCVYESEGIYTVSLTIQTEDGTVLDYVSPGCVNAREPLQGDVRTNVICVDNEPSLTFDSKLETELILRYAGQLSAPIMAGDIVVGSDEEGYARRVLDVTVSGEFLILTTEEASLADIFDQADLAGVVEFTPQDFAKAGVPISKKGLGHLSFAQSVVIDGALELKGSVAFQPRLVLDGRIGGGDPYFKCAFTGQLDLALDATASLLADQGQWTPEASLFKLAGARPLTKVSVFIVYGIPVVVVTEFDILAGASIAAASDVSVSTGFHSVTNVSFGAEYENESWSPIKSFNLDPTLHGPTFTLEADVDGRIYVKPELSVTLYGITGPWLAAEAYVSADVDLLPPPATVTMGVGADLCLGFAAVDLSKFGIDFVLEYTPDPIPIFYHRFPEFSLSDVVIERPVASFTASPQHGTAPLTVHFTDQSDPGDGVITEWRRRFGQMDPNIIYERNPTYTYTEPGTYTPCLLVIGTSGLTYSWTIITVEPNQTPPSADFSATPTRGTAPLTVQFRDESAPGSHPITQWAWDFDDDGEIDSSQQDPQWTYNSSETYDVTLIVTTDAGTDAKTRYRLISVSNPGGEGEGEGETLTVPNVAGMTETAAGTAITGAGLVVGLISQQYSVTVPAGQIMSQSPPEGSSVVLGAAVHLTISLGLGGGLGQTETIMLPGDVPLEMVWIPAGSFMMGRYAGEQDSSGGEDPQHKVTLSSGFWIGKYEVTKAQWTAVMGTSWSDYEYLITDGNSPEVYVYRDPAQSFIAALNTATGLTFRLPSEAEWEYACRAGTTTRFYWGDDPSYTEIGNYAWYEDNAYNAGQTYAHIVGQKLPNAFGLYDMSGNVWEWCEDDWHDNYSGTPPTDGSAWVDSPRGWYGVVRGGSFFDYDGIGDNWCRSASRGKVQAPFPSQWQSDKVFGLGLRLAR